MFVSIVAPFDVVVKSAVFVEYVLYFGIDFVVLVDVMMMMMMMMMSISSFVMLCIKYYYQWLKRHPLYQPSSRNKNKTVAIEEEIVPSSRRFDGDDNIGSF